MQWDSGIQKQTRELKYMPRSTFCLPWTGKCNLHDLVFVMQTEANQPQDGVCTFWSSEPQ